MKDMLNFDKCAQNKENSRRRPRARRSFCRRSEGPSTASTRATNAGMTDELYDRCWITRPYRSPWAACSAAQTANSKSVRKTLEARRVPFPCCETSPLCRSFTIPEVIHTVHKSPNATAQRRRIAIECLAVTHW